MNGLIRNPIRCCKWINYVKYGIELKYPLLFITMDD